MFLGPRVHDLLISGFSHEKAIYLCAKRSLYPCAMAYVDFRAGDTTGHIGVIGPARLNYPYVYPMLRHVSHLLDKISATWN